MIRIIIWMDAHPVLSALAIATLAGLLMAIGSYGALP